MVRQRRSQVNSENNRVDKGTNSSSSNGSNPINTKLIKNTSIFSYWKQIIVCVVLAIAICFGYMGYLETRVNTPLDDKKVVIRSGLDVPDVFWGTYRPGVYFGLKTRDPNSLVAGLMWYFPRRLKPGGDGIRHWCEQGDNLGKYGWLKHDGTNFGIQEIVDGYFKLTTSFVKRPGAKGGEWTARIAVNTMQGYKELKEEVSLIWYTALDEDTKGYIEPTNSATKLTGIRGQTSTLGEFTMKLTNHSGILEHESFLSTTAPGLHLLKETVISSLRLAQDSLNVARKIVLAGELRPMTEKKDPNFVAIQLTGRIPFVVDVIFETESFSNKQETLVGETYTKSLAWHESRFDEKFESKFKLRHKGFTDKQITFAQAALGNMIGGIGYFYGASVVQSVYTKEPVSYWRAPLYTAVPSRSFFPRGFLWDEGFHGLLISKWDLDLELDIMSHWFDLMNVEGWIPREQILGIEALAKVPSEFVVQWNTNANPPTFFLTIQSILNQYGSDLKDDEWNLLERLYPRLQAWFSWFNTTQKGNLPGSYRWRGRDQLGTRELNPKTLTSGLDDYPRASHPDENERHIDLYCWIAIAADTMAKLSKLLGRDGYRYERTAEFLKNNDLMDTLHWSEFAEIYADYGLHTDAVKLERPKPLPRSQNQNLEMYRVVLKKPEYRY
ncbi:mannosyl-oligosaccharide glucosidase GCS1 isoform X2 [Anoplophora glabripennis]|uniref:mannosyl-oligosaccharide glucosidase GCS1 isoform X2 n=1 Tax=Anoplophora glabripennis TaxID=217634 RepID=UPI000C786C41|nr:mannosyl-oligosaccharide glucosidase GCS1 isoform X2 [Anoplophora glabripennis]